MIGGTLLHGVEISQNLQHETFLLHPMFCFLLLRSIPCIQVGRTRSTDEQWNDRVGKYFHFLILCAIKQSKGRRLLSLSCSMWRRQNYSKRTLACLYKKLSGKEAGLWAFLTSVPAAWIMSRMFSSNLIWRPVSSRPWCERSLPLDRCCSASHEERVRFGGWLPSCQVYYGVRSLLYSWQLRNLRTSCLQRCLLPNSENGWRTSIYLTFWMSTKLSCISLQ